jgi:hypothetical protein
MAKSAQDAARSNAAAVKPRPDSPRLERHQLFAEEEILRRTDSA